MADKVKVLSVCTFDSYGGAGRAAYRIHQAIKPFGIESRMFVKFKGRKDKDIVSLQDVVPRNFIYQLYDKVRNKFKNRLQHYRWGRYPDRETFFLSDLRSTDIHGALVKLDYDVLHLHWVNQRFIPLNQLPKNKPIIWTLHDSWPFCGVCHLPLDCRAYQKECGNCPMLSSTNSNDLSHQVWKIKQRLYKHLDLHIVAPSHWLANCAHHSSLFRNLGITVIPNSIDTELFSPGNRADAERRFHLNPKKKHILFGAINAIQDKNKGFRFLVEALNHLFDERSIDLIVFGVDGFDNDLIDSIPVTNLGHIRDVSTLVYVYRAAWVTVVPSLSENLSCTIMESLACGSPVVAFDIGGNSDMVDHKKNGYLAIEKDSLDLANGIRWCFNNNENGQLSLSAREKVLSNFTPAIIGYKYAELYKSLVR